MSVITDQTSSNGLAVHDFSTSNPCRHATDAGEGPSQLTVEQHLTFLEGPDATGNEAMINFPAYANGLSKGGQLEDANYIRALEQFTNLLIDHWEPAWSKVANLLGDLSGGNLLSDRTNMSLLYADGCAGELTFECVGDMPADDRAKWLEGQLQPLFGPLNEIGYAPAYFLHVRRKGPRGVVLTFEQRFVPLIDAFLTQLVADKTSNSKNPANRKEMSQTTE